MKYINPIDRERIRLWPLGTSEPAPQDISLFSAWPDAMEGPTLVSAFYTITPLFPTEIDFRSTLADEGSFFFP
jgi:hypothetical protein